MKLSKNLQLAILAITSGVMFYLAWPPKSLFFLAFFAFVPLFIVEEETSKSKGYGWFIFLGLFVWNVLTTWWVWYASIGGSIFMFFFNSSMMLLPWLAYRKTKKAFGLDKALLAFICLWLAFEYLHLNWQITWPWLTLGNVFAKHNSIIQWYEYTGAMGGTLWVLLINVFAFLAYKKRNWISIAKPAAILIIPIIISFIIRDYRSKEANNAEPLETLIIQPNVDPYKKFDQGEEVKNLRAMLTLVDEKITPNTKYILMPETAIVEYIDEDNPLAFESMYLLKKFTQNHPQTHIITGASTYNFYGRFEKPEPTARMADNGMYYESYNTALEIDSAGSIDYYHKSKLVPGVEKMPYPKLFGFLEYFSLDMGGIAGSLGSDKEPKVFDASYKPEIAPLICYESVFPGFVAGFVRSGADILAIITNDGWWRDTDGYKQHMYYATLRAIENRREVIRSANTGVSGHINTLGEITTKTDWWKAEALKVQTKPSDISTFYSRQGDFLGRYASFIGLFMFFGAFIKLKTAKNASIN